MIRIYHKESLQKQIILIDDLFHYISNVMRMKVGFTLHLFNETDGEYAYTIEQTTRKEAILKQEKKIAEPFALPPLRLAFAPIRKNRLSFLIEKATELGVTELIPVVTDHTQHRDFSLERLNAIAIEATEQCERFSPPMIKEPISFADFINTEKDFIYLDERRDIKTDSLLTLPLPQNPLLLVGPEGGFSKEEFEHMKTGTPVSLGKLILRAETASLKALSILSERYQIYQLPTHRPSSLKLTVSPLPTII
ncbi:MAG: 16S rRNA (uracil(1498)-N(3))-methyltransferase [Alphaproteobacteria bacterium]|nr:16S rRNA (uracil(1498)-N(3))-methyltransferase [Alphaproteobacteria bacterium]MBN2779804.1 16S rRNA (uracil(1498)-N(3))-methyltransferase [Alphaproteobacteria bacterium]